MGKWSRISGRHFIDWLSLPASVRWLDVGCGTGAFSEVILEFAQPGELIGVDTADAHVSHAESQIADDRASFRVGSALELPFNDNEFDIAASAYVLNFVPDKLKMVSEMNRVVRPGGTVAVSVWDHAGRREIGYHFWQVVERRDPEAYATAARGAGWDSTSREAVCGLFEKAGLSQIDSTLIDIEVSFEDFEDYWSANTGFTSSLGRYANDLAPEECEDLKRELENFLPTDSDRQIRYRSHAWAVRGIVPD
jgi:SAM-dependent methyltransferase